MLSEIRRIIAVEAHRRRSGSCPVRLYSLGTGETFEIEPTTEGFVDLASGLSVRVSSENILLAGQNGAIDLHLIGDVAFDGYDHIHNEAFSGRAGGGASVTIYDAGQTNYYQYAVVTETMKL